MKKALLPLIFSTLALAFAACGDNIVPGDDTPGDDGGCVGADCTPADPPDAGMPTADPDGGNGGGADAGVACDPACVVGQVCVDGACVDDAADGVCDEPGTTLLCHYPPGDLSDRHSACVGDASVQAHLDEHGDTLGACE